MLKKIIAVLVAVTFFVSACSAPSTTPTATIAPSSTPIPPTATATPRPAATVKDNASLFSGPGNVDFDTLAVLTAGATVYASAVYGDFVQVTAQVDGQERTGFVWKQALDSIPSDIPELTGDQAPWKPLYQARCSSGWYDAGKDQVVFSNSTDEWFDTRSGAIPLTAPLKISVKGMSIDNEMSAAIKILGIPEPSGGDWWKNMTRMDVGNNAGHYYIGIRDGSTEPYTVFIDLSQSTDQGLQIIFDQPEGKSFHVLDGNGNEVRFVDLTQTLELNLPNGLFPNGVVYIGTTLPPQESLTITGMQIGVQPSGQWVDEENGYYSQPGLAELAAARGITIGTEFGTDLTIDPRYCQIMKRDFSVAALSEFSWPDIWLGPGQYDFSHLDMVVDYASQRGWRIRASHLLYGTDSAIPNWLKNGNYTRDEYIQLMQQYIRDVVSRYKGRVQEWSIANEAINRSYSYGADFWNDHIGPEYIPIAFRTAREADPTGILIFNEDNNEAPQDADTTRVVNKMYATVQQLKADGVPIDVVGMQMHFFLPWNSQIHPDKTAVIATMQKFAALGVRIYITEFDVDLEHLPGTQAEKLELETKVYGDMMQACIESGVCDSFTTWGLSDSTSWLTCDYDWCIEKDVNAAPLIFDVDFNPKPAYFAVRDALLTDFTIVPTTTPTK
jgi:endo-1,4-beta-xylanase